ncbi:uncharacterized protein K441DRAFT_694301 [Cenococcum geophilum 1.58]|uniref:uncharacterized protein n=1 Tax=Cenococcum geophilum 1.58 TaxID=794803 RepID=UPI00358E1F8F|nr:hypothetical protein K441DRAFT_694301 [Cenococcum geophilum 1.58]
MTRAKKTRASHKKSKTGCHTCKIRRVKCDEQKPACQKCLSTSRTCDGYEDSREWVVVAPPSSILVLDGFEDDQGRRYFDFFRSQSSFEFSRFFDSGIWGKLVLQAAYSSPAVRHAVIALASSHKEFKYRSMLTQWEMAHSSKECAYGAQQYGKAVRHLKQLSEKGQQGHAIALICGLLFIPFEVLRGNNIAALYHLEGCVKILNETRSAIGLQGRPPTQASSAASENDVEQELLPIFARLDLEASLYMGLRSPNLYLDYPEISESDYPSPVFLSVLDASNCLNSIMNRMHKFTRSTGDHFRYRSVGDVPIGVVSEQHTLLSQLSKWQCAFDGFLSHYQTPLHHVAQEEKQINLLQIHHDVSTTTLACTLHAEELAYDAFNPMFAQIVSLAKILHNTSSAEPKPHKQQQQEKSPPATFSLETGIILPLYWTAIKCRDGRIRRQAVALLRTCQQEGVWIGEIQAEIAKRVIEIEEGELFDCATPQRVFKTSQDIPEWVRIHSVGMTLDETRREAKIACLQRLNGPDGEWDEREELVFW